MCCDMRVDLRVDMCVDMRVGMRVDMCVDMRVAMHMPIRRTLSSVFEPAFGHAVVHGLVSMCLDVAVFNGV